MNASELAASVMVGLGFALVVVGVLSRVYARDERLADILDLPYGDRDVDLAAVAQQSTIVENISSLAGKVVTQFDDRGSLMGLLEKARVPVRPGEFVVLVAAVGLVIAAFIAAITSQVLLGVVGLLAAPFMASTFLKQRIARRRKKFEEQFPDALSLIASSLSAGHTFLRSIQMMCEESPAPLSEEFSRVVSETQLGDPLVDALERMGQRLQIRDVDWVVQAIRIQQAVGGRLADLLHTLADFIRAREDVRREIQVLTAEGRISAYVLGALAPVLLVIISVLNPDYMKPMFQMPGLIWLVASGMLVVLGVMFIQKMVKIEV